MKKIVALRQASDVTNIQCNGFFKSKTAGVGGLLGKDQNGAPSLVLLYNG